ncbi:MAG: tRNA 2-thiocytidine(32) synthetase TtcA [Pseudomonadota bacterium]
MADGTSSDPYTTAARRLFARSPGSGAFNRLRARLARQTRRVVETWQMDDQPGARWLIGLSGGKDSYALLAVLLDLKAQGHLKADLLACNLDQGQPGFPKDVLPNWLANLGVPFRVEARDTYSIVTEKVPEDATYCALCSRLRRGHLYRVAREEACTALVLGHHRDDALETLMLNLAHAGRLAAMPAKLVNDAGDLAVLRPLITTAENDLARFSTALDCPIIPCDLCGSQDGLQRQAMKRRLEAWAIDTPGLRESMAKALENVRPGHLLDTGLARFETGDDPSVP